MIEAERNRPAELENEQKKKQLSDYDQELIRNFREKNQNAMPPSKFAEMVFNGGVATKTSHRISCYVLIGYKGDTFEAAEKRLQQVLDLGMTPFAMLYRNESGNRNPEWISFQAQWANPTKIYGQRKKLKATLFKD